MPTSLKAYNKCKRQYLVTEFHRMEYHRCTLLIPNWEDLGRIVNTSVLPSGALTAVNVTFHGCHHLVIARVGSVMEARTQNSRDRLRQNCSEVNPATE